MKQTEGDENSERRKEINKQINKQIRTEQKLHLSPLKIILWHILVLTN